MVQLTGCRTGPQETRVHFPVKVWAHRQDPSRYVATERDPSLGVSAPVPSLDKIRDSVSSKSIQCKNTSTNE